VLVGVALGVLVDVGVGVLVGGATWAPAFDAAASTSMTTVLSARTAATGAFRMARCYINRLVVELRRASRRVTALSRSHSEATSA
jgi:hypothetical protein